MKHKKLIIVTSIAAAAALGTASVTASAGTAIETAAAQMGQLDCELELNGKVESLNEKTYFSKISGRIGSVNVKEGDLVKAGDIIMTYDMDEISMEQTLAELDIAADQGGYDASKQAGGRVAGLYGEAKNTIAELNAQIEMTEAVIIMTRQALTDRQSELSARGAQLEADLACCVPDEDDDPDEVQRAKESIQGEIARNAYEQQYDPEIIKKQEELNFLEYLMSTYKEKKSVMESQKASTQLNLQTEGDKAQLEAEKAASDLVNENRLKDLEYAAEGIRAEFDGVVTKLYVSDGSSVSAGAQLVQVQSLDKVAVVCNVNKYDIISIEEGQSASAHIRNKDFECHVSRIERKTSDDGISSGIRVELEIDAPDDTVILGIEAKTKVRTAMLAYALLVPTDAVYSDENEDYVFVINEGRAEKRAVEIGIRNDDMAEIRKGLQEGETVGWDENGELSDGMKVKVIVP